MSDESSAKRVLKKASGTGGLAGMLYEVQKAVAGSGEIDTPIGDVAAFVDFWLGPASAAADIAEAIENGEAGELISAGAAATSAMAAKYSLAKSFLFKGTSQWGGYVVSAPSAGSWAAVGKAVKIGGAVGVLITTFQVSHAAGSFIDKHLDLSGKVADFAHWVTDSPGDGSRPTQLDPGDYPMSNIEAYLSEGMAIPVGIHEQIEAGLEAQGRDWPTFGDLPVHVQVEVSGRFKEVVSDMVGAWTTATEGLDWTDTTDMAASDHHTGDHSGIDPEDAGNALGDVDGDGSSQAGPHAQTAEPVEGVEPGEPVEGDLGESPGIGEGDVPAATPDGSPATNEAEPPAAAHGGGSTNTASEPETPEASGGNTTGESAESARSSMAVPTSEGFNVVTFEVPTGYHGLEVGVQELPEIYVTTGGDVSDLPDGAGNTGTGDELPDGDVGDLPDGDGGEGSSDLPDSDGDVSDDLPDGDGGDISGDLPDGDGGDEGGSEGGGGESDAAPEEEP